MPTKPPAGQTTTNVYHVYGHNPRWNTHSTDQSVNSVTLSNDQIFVTLRQKIESEVPEGDQRNDILDKLQALEKRIRPRRHLASATRIHGGCREPHSSHLSFHPPR